MTPCSRFHAANWRRPKTPKAIWRVTVGRPVGNVVPAPQALCTKCKRHEEGLCAQRGVPFHAERLPPGADSSKGY